MSVEKSEEKEKSEKNNEVNQNLIEKPNNIPNNIELNNKQSPHSIVEKSNIIQKQESFNINNNSININATISYLNPKYNFSVNNSLYHTKKKRSFSSLNIFNRKNQKNSNLRNFCQINFQRQKAPKLSKYNIDCRFERTNKKSYYYPKNNKINFVSFNKSGFSSYLQIKKNNENNKLIYMNKNTNYNFYNRYKKANENDKNNYNFDYSNGGKNNVIEGVTVPSKDFAQTYYHYYNNANINYSYYNTVFNMKENKRELKNDLFSYIPKPYQNFFKSADKFKENEKKI